MSLLSYLTGTEDQASQDARLAQMKQNLDQARVRALNDGVITEQQSQNLQDYAANTNNDSEAQAAGQGFVEGAKEGLNNVLDAPGKLVGGVGSGASQVLGGILKNIPWWVYVGAVVAAFFYLGGLAILKGRLAKLA